MIEDMQQKIQDFFTHFGIEIETLTLQEEEPGIFHLHIQTPESGLLIGYSGKNIQHLNTILKSILITQFTHKHIILHIEINDYLKQKDDKLYQFINKKIDELRQKGGEVVLPYFNAYERKKIHSYVSDLKDDTISTKSVGEGQQRRLHLCKTSQTLTLDMDTIDI